MIVSVALRCGVFSIRYRDKPPKGQLTAHFVLLSLFNSRFLFYTGNESLLCRPKQKKIHDMGLMSCRCRGKEMYHDFSTHVYFLSSLFVVLNLVFAG